MLDGQFDQGARDTALRNAAAAGFSETDLIETHVAIATMAARLYARNRGQIHDFAQGRTGDDHAMTLLAFDGDAPSRDLRQAILDLSELPFENPRDLADMRAMAALLGYHAETARTYPDLWSASGWWAHLHDIRDRMMHGIDLIERGEGVHGRDLLRRTLEVLVEALPSLWS